MIVQCRTVEHLHMVLLLLLSKRPVLFRPPQQVLFSAQVMLVVFRLGERFLPPRGACQNRRRPR